MKPLRRITINDPAQVKATLGDGAQFIIGPARSDFPCGTVTINGEVWGRWNGDSFIDDLGLSESPLQINWPSE